MEISELKVGKIYTVKHRESERLKLVVIDLICDLLVFESLYDGSCFFRLGQGKYNGLIPFDLSFSSDLIELNN